MKKLATLFLFTAAVVAVLFWVLTSPSGLDSDELPNHQADLSNGEAMFHAGACASCHLTEGEKDGSGNLGGGHQIVSDFGVFIVPNISSDAEMGIGSWTETDFINAMMFGVSPRGQHYYPAFPYTSYARMDVADVLDLKAYLGTLPAVSHNAGDHQLSFPWNLRRGVGLWKLRYLDAAPVVTIDESDPLLKRGRYLVEGPAHCAECHTARDVAGGLRMDRWLAGAPNPDGKGRVPNITPHQDGLADWSEKDLVYYFQSGMDPEFDTAGGSMVAVQENLARLTEYDRQAIAAYLKAVPALARSNSGGD